LGISVEDAAEQVGLSAAQLIRIESGDRRLEWRVEHALFHFYGLSEPASLLHVVPDTLGTRSAWYPVDSPTLSGFEQRSRFTRTVGIDVLPRSLRTEEVLRDIFLPMVVHKVLKAVDVQTITGFHAAGLERISSPELGRHQFVIGESVLRYPVSRGELLPGQIRQIAALDSAPHVEIRVATKRLNVVQAASPAFSIHSFEWRSPVVCVDVGAIDIVVTEEETAAARYDSVFRSIWSSATPLSASPWWRDVLMASSM